MILVVVAMSLLLIGALGLAIDGGQMYAQRQMAQAAADAAAQAGIMSIFDGTNVTSANPFGTGATPIASSVCTTTDLRTPCVYARNNGFGGTAADTVTLSFPAAASGVTFSSAAVPVFAVSVQRTLQTGLIRFLGAPATSSIIAKGTAGLVGIVSPDSIILLGSGANALQVTGSGSVNVTGGGIAINSANADAATVSGTSTIAASVIDIVGGISIKGSASTTPAAVTGTAPIADPLASLPAPAVGACNFTNYSLSGVATATIGPGTYCGGISAGNSANLTLTAGNYIINGGGVNFSGAAIVNGNGVMFYLTGTNATYASATIGNSASVTLSAPSSGTYTGILFFQNRSITSASNAAISGAASTSLTGTLYFPTTSVSLTGSAGVATDMAVVASALAVTGAASIQYDPTGLKSRSVLEGRSAGAVNRRRKGAAL